MILFKTPVDWFSLYFQNNFQNKGGGIQDIPRSLTYTQFIELKQCYQIDKVVLIVLNVLIDVNHLIFNLTG